MTRKQGVDLDTYSKRPRVLSLEMLSDLEAGVLTPILEAVHDHPELRLDIRDQCFNVYYCGGNLLQVVCHKGQWVPHFADKYCRLESKAPLVVPEWLARLPKSLDTQEATREWVDAFQMLRDAMDAWWIRNPKGERAHCQLMAKANGEVSGKPSSDYLVLDTEYQWGQRRLDLMAAKRSTPSAGGSGWERPVLAFIEVKSLPGAVDNESGIDVHVQDFGEIVGQRPSRKPPAAIEEIKKEFVKVVDQKRRLGLLSKELPLLAFSDAPPEMLLVFVGLDISDRRFEEPLDRIEGHLPKLDGVGNLRFMCLETADSLMWCKDALDLSGFQEKRGD
jgi:hypothetical protein